MDLIYTDAARVDVGVLLDYELDLAFGSDENSLECKVSSASHCLAPGAYLYMEGTEYGGIVDKIASDNAAKEVTYTGRTWQGILNSKVLEPDAGQDYLVCSGEANTVLGTLIARMGLSSLFTASTADSGVTVSNYQMGRYIGGYDGIKKMLAAFGGKLKVTYTAGNVVLSAAPKVDYTKDEQFDSDLVELKVSRTFHPVNHLICLGKGELAERTVLHLYADTAGNISETQTQFGLDEVAAIYDYSAVESVAELKSSGADRLKELWEPDKISVNLDSDAESFDIGDIVGAMDNVTRLEVQAEITKKIVTISNGKTTIFYKVGE